MRKLLILFTALIALASCKKSNVEIFDERPEVRMSMSLAEVRTALLGAPNGWIATMPTSAGGGYGFYMQFDASENVTMYSDLGVANSPSTTTLDYVTPLTSTYRLKAVLGVELIFDTFNYTSYLVDPMPSVFGGAAATGYKSDIEFLFTRATTDSLIFTGKKYRQVMAMVKATAAQKASYEAGGYKTAIDNFKAFFENIKNPYIEYTSGSATLKAAISMNFSNVLATGKRVSFTGLLADGAVATAESKFGLTIDGASLPAGLSFQGINFTRIAWKDATTMAFYDTKGSEYVIKSNPVPLTPLASLYKYNGTYNGLFISGQVLPAGVTSDFNGVFNAMVNRFNGTGRTITSVEFKLLNSTTAKLEIWYMSNTSAFLADASFTYTYVNDVITLSNYVPAVSNANWTTRITQIGDFKDWFINGTFRVDWVVSSNPATGTLGGLYRTTDAGSVMYGTPRKI
ncbi:DUF4302 domain-containing protein [Pedobacter helvus]|uniref:DUF4302 domain-containing protein n=1 Tax=Pedobacter helvus TaxID=2563444 RepID=A0ABW9JN92_9SPHI|nr:DUF4302 domain-containing protein [Pedobacter ureilyticus]